MTNSLELQENAFKQTQKNQEVLLKKIQLLRHYADLNATDEALKKNIGSAIPTNAGFFSKVTSNVSNSYKNNQTSKLTPQRMVIEGLIKQLSYYEDSYENLERLVRTMFENDKGNIAKILFSLTVISDESQYYYSDYSMRVASYLLWNDYEFLHNLKVDFEKKYKQLSNTGLSTKQILGIAGIGTAIAISSVFLIAPLFGGAALGGASAAASATTSTLANAGAIFGGTMIGGLKCTALTTLLLTSSGAIGSYTAMKKYNGIGIKNELKTMTYNEMTYFITLKSLQLDIAQKTMSTTEFKEYLNDMLVLLGDLKSDSMYYALVEKKEKEKHKKLTDAYQRLDKMLLEKF